MAHEWSELICTAMFLATFVLLECVWVKRTGKSYVREYVELFWGKLKAIAKEMGSDKDGEKTCGYAVALTYVLFMTSAIGYTHFLIWEHKLIAWIWIGAAFVGSALPVLMGLWWLNRYFISKFKLK